MTLEQLASGISITKTPALQQLVIVHARIIDTCGPSVAKRSVTDDRALHSSILPSTPAQLHLVAGTRPPLVWSYRNDAGQLVVLDGTDTLISEYPGNVGPATAVNLTVFNATGAQIEIEVVPHGAATVSPNKPQLISNGQSVTWSCVHAGGESCDCATQLADCRCGSWSVKGAPQPDGVVIPDPTFKVRWQAQLDDRRSP